MSGICVLFLVIRPVVFSSCLRGNGFIRAEYVIERMLFDIELTSLSSLCSHPKYL